MYYAYKYRLKLSDAYRESWTATETFVGNCTTTRATASTSTTTTTANSRP